MSPTHAAIPGVALICSAVAFIIAICCLVAGTNPTTLKGMELYTLNTSMAGPTLLKDLHLPAPNASVDLNNIFGRSIIDDAKDAASNVAKGAKDTAQGAAQDAKDAAGDAVDKAKKELQAAEDAVKNAAATIVSDFINATIETLDIQQFYVAHLLTYCEGDYMSNRKENITYCSNHSPNHKNSSQSVNVSSIPSFLSHLDLPDPVEYGMKAATLITKVISLFYIFGLLATFAALVLSALCVHRHIIHSDQMGLLRFATLGCAFVSFGSLLLASLFIHFMVGSICGFFHDNPRLGVAAGKGGLFIGCSWAAVALMGVAVLALVADLFLGRSSGRRESFEKGYVMEER